jgi:hypothetical protein
MLLHNPYHHNARRRIWQVSVHANSSIIGKQPMSPLDAGNLLPVSIIQRIRINPRTRHNPMAGWMLEHSIRVSSRYAHNHIKSYHICSRYNHGQQTIIILLALTRMTIRHHCMLMW